MNPTRTELDRPEKGNPPSQTRFSEHEGETTATLLEAFKETKLPKATDTQGKTTRAIEPGAEPREVAWTKLDYTPALSKEFNERSSLRKFLQKKAQEEEEEECVNIKVQEA